MGFDACMRFNGRLFIFQFKASDYVLGSGAYRFYAPHHQLVALQKLCKVRRSVFYVFPLIGTIFDLRKNTNILMSSWLLDVAILPSGIAPPQKKSGKLRKNEMHYIDVVPGWATIYSDPFNVALLGGQDFLMLGTQDLNGVQSQFQESFERFWEFCSLFSRNTICVVVYGGNRVRS